MTKQSGFTKLVVAAIAGIAIFAAAFTTIGLGARQSASADPMNAVKAAPFAVLMPTYVPAGAQLMRTDVFRNADGSADADLIYVFGNNKRLHLWETTRAEATLGAKNPLSTGTDVKGTLTTWRQDKGMDGAVVTLSARIGQVLITIDGPLSVEELLRVADSVR